MMWNRQQITITFYSLMEQHQYVLRVYVRVWGIIGLVPEVASNMNSWEEDRLLLWKMLLLGL